MKVTSLGYLIGQGWRSMVANKLMTLASIGVLTACLFITGIAVLLNLNVNSYVEYLSSQNVVEVYLADDTPEQTAYDLRVAVETLENISSCEYITKDMALQEMKVFMGENADLLEPYENNAASENPLPASLRAKVSDLALLDETVNEITTIVGGYTYKISVPEDLSDVLLEIQQVVSYVGWGIVAVLGIVSIVIISNTIRLTVFARRKEINIMKYVGATNAFIRLPFFVEGMTVGAIAGLLATIFVGGGYYALIYTATSPESTWSDVIVQNLLPFEYIMPMLAGAFVLFGIFIGSMGCSNSIRKHLKV